jgi:RND superfamily putative drug exporter
MEGKMNKLINAITDRVTTRKGMWVTLAVWLIITLLLAGLAPSARDYVVTSIDSIPEDADSVVAQNKIDQYFQDSDGIPALLVFQSSESELELVKLTNIMENVAEEQIEGIKELVSLTNLPPQATEGFFSEDRTTAVIPLIFESSLDIDEIKEAQGKIQKIAEESPDLTLYITGPAGIATDAVDLFSRADIVLLLSTVGIILILLIVIYRSPLLAFIPLIAAGFVYFVVNQILGLMGMAGLPLGNQSLSIMSILLFAAVIDYSLFVFSRFREELKNHENKYTAMKSAMRETGIPVFYAGGTVLAAMLVLFFAEFGDYRNFAPTFGTTMFVIMIASITLVPALFTLFGRKSFWPKVPRVGDEKIAKSSFWGKVGRFVVKKPTLSIIMVGVILIVSASNMFNLNYQFDTIKSFPDDMPSREGYEILEEKFESGDLAPTTVLLESDTAITQKEQEEFRATLADQPLVSNVSINGMTDDNKVMSLRLTFEESPYSIESMGALETIKDNANQLIKDLDLEGELYFAGETATQVDDRSINNRDLVVIASLETALILIMLIFLTKSIKIPIYMMGTILLSFLAALGLGMFLTSLFFDIDSISNRVPLYAFVFLVALGIDYNIILISRFIEERKNHDVKTAVEIAVSSTGGVISSAGILLAATFAVLMTQPIQILFVFGFIVAVGILLDTFLIRGVLLPALLVLFEKEKEVSKN